MTRPAYFQLFDIPISLKIDRQQLRSRFLELSRKFHPDFHANAGEKAQQEALEKSALLNKAWNTFASTDATIRYVLLSKGLMVEEEKYELPGEFLMEVLEMNDQLLDSDSADAALLPRLQQLEKEIYAPVQHIVEGYDETVHSDSDLLKVKEYYYKKKYLDRIRSEKNARS